MKIRAFANVAVVLLAGCASSEPVAQADERTDPVSVEDLLTWPLEGAAGADKTIAALREVMQFRERQNPGQFASRGPAQIAGGHALSFANFTPATRIIDIGVAKEPCFATAKAAAITQAVADPVTESMHGVDMGQTYNVVRNGMRVMFTTTKKPYACLDSIHIDKERSR